MTHGTASVMICGLARRLDDDRRGPGGAHLARLLPDDPPGAPIERVELGLALFAFALVQLHDQPVAPGRQRSGVAIGIFERAEALGPDRLALEAERRQVAIGEDDIDPAPVRGHRRGRVTGSVWDLRRLGRAAGDIRHRPGARASWPVLASRQKTSRLAASPPEKKTRSPQTIGELNPAAGTGDFQANPAPVFTSQSTGHW